MKMWQMEKPVTMKMDFVSLNEAGVSQLVHSKSDHREIMIGVATDENIEECFDTHIHRYQVGLEKSVKGSRSVFNHVDRLFYRCHKVSLNRSGSNIDFLK